MKTTIINELKIHQLLLSYFNLLNDAFDIADPSSMQGAWHRGTKLWHSSLESSL